VLVTAATTIAQTNCFFLPSGVVAWWKGEGNGVDIIGSNSASLVGGVGFAQGKAGQAFSFDGIGASASNSVPALTNIQNSYTIEFWAYPTAGRASSPEATGGLHGTSGQRYAIFPNFGGTGPAGPAGAGVSVGTNGISVFEHGDTYLPSLLVYDAPILGWNHIAIVYSNRQPRLYLNGVLVRTGITSLWNSCPSTILGGRIFNIDNTPLNYGFYAGLLDEVSIYNRSLTETEVQSIYNAGSAGKCVTTQLPSLQVAASGSDLVVSWPLWVTNFTLQESSVLTGDGTTWTNTTASVVITQGQNTVTLPMNAGPKWYRLRQ